MAFNKLCASSKMKILFSRRIPLVSLVDLCSKVLYGKTIIYTNNTNEYFSFNIHML